jgi:sterol 3beta-glucosyltransferase
MAAAVHHGGAGTTAAALRAGLPSLIVPFIADQPFWGEVVHQAGVGPRPIAQGKLTVDGLARAIGQLVSDEAMRQRAQALGDVLRAEDGVGAAVRALAGLLGR